jgi:hypothetical protein
MAKSKNNFFSVLLFIIILGTFSLDSYKLSLAPDFLNLSIARLATLLLLGSYVFKILFSRRISFFELIFLLFLIWCLLISVLNGLSFDNYFIMLVYSVSLCLISYYIIKNSSIKKLFYYTSAIRFSIVLLMFFSFYTLFVFFSTRSPPSELPIGIFKIILTPRNEGHSLISGGFSLGSLTRISIPFSRPQDLGATASSLFFLFIIARKVTRSYLKIDSLLFIGLVAIIFLTGSRSVIFPFVFGLFLIFILRWRNFIIIMVKKRVMFLLFPLFVFLIYIYRFNVINFLSNFNRILLVLEGNSSQAHLNVRLYALKLSFDKGFIGSGIGSFNKLTGISSAHSTFFTFIVDIGLIGLLIFCLGHIILLKQNQFPKLIKYESFALVSVLTLYHLFYNFPTLSIFYISLGFLAGLGVYSKRNNLYNRRNLIN